MSEILISRLDQLPDFLSSQDLVGLGLYPSEEAVYLARYRGDSPDYIKLKRKVLYPKSSVIAFIDRHLVSGSVSRADQDSKQGSGGGEILAGG